MKYIISESQAEFLMEQDWELWIRRRANFDNLRSYVDNSIELHSSDLCRWPDEYDYAQNVLDWAITDFLSVREEFYNSERFDDFYDWMMDYSKQLFAEELFAIYRDKCSDEDMEIEVETNLNSLQEQQSKPIPINLYKEPNAVGKYCKAQKVPKELVDSKIPDTLANFSEQIEKQVQSVITQYPETKPFKKKFDKLLIKIKPLLETIVTNSIYSRFGYSNYNPNNDAKKAIDIIYSELLSEMKSYSLLAKALINKKNVGYIKKQMIEGINRYSRIVKIAIQLPTLISSVNILSKYSKQLPECKNVIVVVDENMNKLKPNEQYHPKFPIYVSGGYEVVDIDELIKPYLPQLNQIIDSFV